MAPQYPLVERVGRGRPLRLGVSHPAASGLPGAAPQDCGGCDNSIGDYLTKINTTWGKQAMDSVGFRGARASWLALALALAGFAGSAVYAEARQPSTEPSTHSVVTGSAPQQLEQAESVAAGATRGADAPARWWAPGEDRPFPEFIEYANASGRARPVQQRGPARDRGPSLLRADRRNGRACVSCHQPADGMSLSLASHPRAVGGDRGQGPDLRGDRRHRTAPACRKAIRPRIRCCSSAGCSGSSCRGRPRRPTERRIDPEFTIEVVRDPGGCNTDPQYGLNSANPMISVYRRPRVVANMQYVVHQQLRRRPLRRQDRRARGARSRQRPAGQHEHDGRRAPADAENAGGRSRASRTCNLDGV